MKVLTRARVEFGEALAELLAEGVTAWETPVAQEMRELSIVDVDGLFVSSRIDWSTVDMSMAARMRRGANHLRHYYPQGRLHLNPRLVDIASCQHCVLGQIWGNFVRSLENRLLGVGFCVAHGFASSGDGAGAITADAWALTDAWRIELDR